MTKFLRWMIVAALVLVPSLGSVARADINCSTCGSGNTQEGDNESSTDQSGTSASGDAVGGQVVGVVSSGDTSVDATNRSDDVDISTGDAEGSNSAASFTGLNYNSTETSVTADINAAVAASGNIQEGDNESDISQTADAASGDGVGGQVIGVVTSAGGSADVVAANTTTDSDVDTGDAEADNSAAAFVGLNKASKAGQISVTADINGGTLTGNVQEGDNSFDGSQEATAASGDGVAGQVLGIVSAGDASVDATNRTDDSSVSSGDTEASNSGAAFVGLNYNSTSTGVTADINAVGRASGNLQEGDNDGSFDQVADAASGDAVAGQVAGVVTSAGGSADLVLSNTSTDVDSDTGESEFDNSTTLFTGLNYASSGGILFL